MHSRACAVTAGGLLAVGVLFGAAVAEEPEPTPPLENGFLIEADPVDADDLEEVFTRDLQFQGVVVRYTDGSVTVFQREVAAPPEAEAADAEAAPAEAEAADAAAAPAEADAAGAEAAPETAVGGAAAAETTVAAAAAPTIGILTEDDIRTHVIGNTTTRFVRGSWWMEYYAPDGRIAGRWRNLPIEGTWAVRDEAMCFDYAGSRRDFCARLSIDEATVSLYNADGVRYERTLSLLPGNPGNL